MPTEQIYKFKIGDRVILTIKNNDTFYQKHNGKLFTIIGKTSVYGTKGYDIKNSEIEFAAMEIELTRPDSIHKVTLLTKITDNIYIGKIKDTKYYCNFSNFSNVVLHKTLQILGYADGNKLYISEVKLN